MSIRYVLIGVGILATGLSSYLIWPEWFGLCNEVLTNTQGLICRSPYEVEIGDPGLPLSITFLIASLLAFFTTRRTYSLWARFSLWCGILVVPLLFALSHMKFAGFALNDVSMWAGLLAVLYGFLSLLLLGTSELPERLRRKGAGKA